MVNMNQSDNNNIVYENINDKFRYAKYLDFRVIEEIETGFINATKLCALAGKRFDNWLPKQHAKELIKELDKFVPANKGTNIKLVNYGSNKNYKELSGSYVHRDLAVHIASWCSPKFALKVSKIVNQHIENENRRLIRENERLKNDNQQKGDKIDELTLKLDQFREEQRKSHEEMKQKVDGLLTINEEQTSVLNDIRHDVALTVDIIEEIHENVVEPNDDPELKEKFIVMQDEDIPNNYVVVRCQQRNERTSISKKQRSNPKLKIVYNIDSYKNPVNFYNRFKEYMKKSTMYKNEIQFKYNDFTTQLDLNVIINIFETLKKEASERLKNVPINV